MCEGELCCLEHRRKVCALCLVCNMYHRVDHLLHEYLHYFVIALNARGSAALCELALVILRCRIGQFCWSFLPVAARMWNLLALDVFSGGTLSSFKSTVNLWLQRA